MKHKKVFLVLTLCVFVCSVLIAEGLRFGMAGAVKQKVVELDEKVVEKKAAERRAQQKTLSALNDIITAGYYDATTLSAVDTDLAVGNIKPGITIFGFAGTYTSDADAVSGNILSAKTAYVNGVKLTGTLAAQTLSAANDTVTAGYYDATTLSTVDTDLAVGNIKPGITIFGFAGTYTSDADAIAGNILSAKTAYVNGVKITGTLAAQTLSADNDTVTAGNYDATTLSAVDTDLAVGNIKSGVNIFGKIGTLPSYCVPDTDQVTSYTATPGEDHDYQPAATQMNYTLNGTTTTTDNRTGLEWAQDGTGAGCNNGALLTWEAALTFCEGLNFAGRTDWRLPNAKELFSIVRFEGAAPFINQTAFPNTVSDWYWTSTTYVLNTPFAMLVRFALGVVSIDGKAGTYYVRPVRGGP